MLTRFSLPQNQFLLSVFLSVIAFLLLNTLAYATDATEDGSMTVLNMEEMEHLAGGPYRSPKDAPAIPANCGSVCGFCYQYAFYTFKSCFCNGSSFVPYCKEKESGKGWSKYSCGCALWTCSTKFFMGSGGKRYTCVTKKP